MESECGMFLKESNRRKDGKDHRYYRIVENRRMNSGRHVQKTLLYLGEINDSQKASWTRTIDVIQGNDRRQMSIFPSDRSIPAEVENGVQLKIHEMELRRPRQWGACWLISAIWEKLGLNEFWESRLEPSRKGTDWRNVLQTLVSYRVIDPGSEWRLHRYWYEQSAMGDILGRGMELAAKDTLYRCHDKLLAHKEDLFKHLRRRWEDMFGSRFDVLLYDLTSTYFESNLKHEDKRQYGYSRDKRGDCVQVVIGLVVTPNGLPLAYEVFPGNTQDKQTLRDMIRRISDRYGKAERVWIMDRGVPTEDVLEEMRKADIPIRYLVGTPRGRLTRYETELSMKDWRKVRDSVRIKYISADGETYILAESTGRRQKERGIRKRKVRKLLERLKELQGQKIDRDKLLRKVGAAEKDAGQFSRLLDIRIPDADEPINAKTFYWKINREKYRRILCRDGCYLLRTNQTATDPADIWNQYMVLVEVEEAFRNLKGDLAIRPIYHKLEQRVEAHIFVSFIAYCLHVTLRNMVRNNAPGLTPRSIIEQMKTIQMIDVHIPTVDGRELKMSRYTKPEKTHQLLLAQLNMNLPPQPPPEISASSIKNQGAVVQTF